MILSIGSAAADYERVTGKKPNGFYCPLTGRTHAESAVMRGHIINDAIKLAPRRTVPVSRAVDHYFGSKLEPELIRYINMRVWGKREFLKHSKGLAVIGGDGRRWRIFPYSKNSRPPFPILEVPIDDGEPPVVFFVRMPVSEIPTLGPIDDLEVTGTFEVHNLAVIGALCKAAHLSLFSTIGYYRIFHDLGGIELSRVLSRHFQENEGKRSPDFSIFEPYRNCVKIAIRPGTRVKNSIEDDQFVIHSHRQVEYSWFAITVLLPMNRFVFSITVPTCDRLEYTLKKRFLYQRMMQGDHSFVQSNQMRHEGDRWVYATSPVRMIMPSREESERIMRDASAELEGGVG